MNYISVAHKFLFENEEALANQEKKLPKFELDSYFGGRFSEKYGIDFINLNHIGNTDSKIYALKKELIKSDNFRADAMNGFVHSINQNIRWILESKNSKEDLNQGYNSLWDYSLYDEDLFDRYVKIWDSVFLQEESLENIIDFERYLVLCKDEEKVDKHHKEWGEKNKCDSADFIEINPYNNDASWDDTYYNNQLDMDQQSPEFWDSQ